MHEAKAIATNEKLLLARAATDLSQNTPRYRCFDRKNMQYMAPPDTYGPESRVAYDSYGEESYSNVPRTPSRQQSPESWTPATFKSSSKQAGYREDYSRAQHACLDEQPNVQQPGYSIHRAKSDVGPAASQQHLRFSAYVNRFASHDPRTTPVHSNKGVSVSERIARFNNASPRADANGMQRPLTPQSYQPKQYRSPPHPSRQHAQEQAQHAQEQAQHARSAPRQNGYDKPESSYRRHQDMAQDHYRSPSAEPRQHQQTPAPPGPSHSRSASVEEHASRQSSSREQRPQSPAAQKPEAKLGSPSRSIDTHRAARSLLAKRRQRRLEQEAKQEGATVNEETNEHSSNEAQLAQTMENRMPLKTSVSSNEGRTDRILREARSRSMSPRTSRYGQKVSSSVRASPTLLNGNPERPVHAMDYRTSTPEKHRARGLEYRATTPEQLMRAVNHQNAAHIAVRQQEPVSPMTTASPVARSPQRNARVTDSANSVITSESNTTSSVQELKRQLWDDNEKLQVAVKPSLPANGYSDRQTKLTTGYYSPEMAGRQGQRVRSLSPIPRRQGVYGHERPASAVGPSPSSEVHSSSAMFNSKFYQAALASHREIPITPQPAEAPRNVSSAPQVKTNYPTTTAYRHPPNHEDHAKHREQSPRPPVAPARGEQLRSSPEEVAENSPRASQSPVTSATHSIERVPSSAGVSTATGEASVAKLVAKLSSVSRDDPEKALQMIDSILRAESKSSSGAPGSRAGSRSEGRSPKSLQNEDGTTDVVDEDDNDESDSSDTSDDDTSISSITNPTYQRDDKANTHVHVASTSNFRSPRPSALKKYTQQQTSPSSQDGSRGKSSKAKKEKKPPPPATINVNTNDAKGSNAEKSKKEKKGRKSTQPSPPSNNQRLDPYAKLQPENDAMDAAAIALKIRGWDQQLSSRNTPPRSAVPIDSTPLSPTRTEDTANTEELGSIITPQSPQKKLDVSESRRAHPWDDHRPQSGKSPTAIDLTIGTGTGNGFGNEEIDAFAPSSPWRRRRAAKQESDERGDPAAPTDWASGAGTSTDRRHHSASSGFASESPRANPIAPNVFDVHRKRRSRSRESRPEPSQPSSQEVSRTEPSRQSNRDSRSESSRSSRDRRPTSTKSDTGNVFDSAWVALPADAFPSQPATSGRKLPDAVASAFSDEVDLLDSLGPQLAVADLPPRTPTNRAPFGKDELPEASRDLDQGGGSRLRRSLMKFKRSTTPKKDRQSPQPRSTKPLLSGYEMDSLADVHDEFKMRGRTSRAPARRSRTLSPVPRSAMKSPGRNRSWSRTKSLAGEDETQSLTGSLTGSKASSMRNKNLAMKFSRFLKVYED